MKYILSFFSSILVATSVQAANLNFTVNNLKNSNGMILVSVFAQEDGFPSEAKNAFRTMKLKIKSQAAQFTLKDIPEGTYALAFVHDENNNGKMDQNALGIPKEGYAFSRDAKVRFGPPAFVDAAIEVNETDNKAEATMRYF